MFFSLLTHLVLIRAESFLPDRALYASEISSYVVSDILKQYDDGEPTDDVVGFIAFPY
ncbi:hypothetical protein L6R49_02020 [Myxococcota bacterium]|nr:hypothetical protein [Myxococcota bacterium]